MSGGSSEELFKTRLEFGLRIKAWREANGWSLRKLAKELEVSAHLIHYWEQGLKYPGPEPLRRLNDLFESMARTRGLNK